MNDLQVKLLSTFLLVLGLGLLGYGGYDLFLAWEHNQDLAETDRAVGGLLNAFNDALGTDMTMSYQRGGMVAGIGALCGLLGWLVLGQLGRR